MGDPERGASQDDDAAPTDVPESGMAALSGWRSAVPRARALAAARIERGAEEFLAVEVRIEDEEPLTLVVVVDDAFGPVVRRASAEHGTLRRVVGALRSRPGSTVDELSLAAAAERFRDLDAPVADPAFVRLLATGDWAAVRPLLRVALRTALADPSG